MPLITIKKCRNCEVSHEWLFESATLKELRMIKKLTGMRANEFAEAGDSGDPEALAALLYVLHLRDKIQIPLDEVDLDFMDFDMRPTEEEIKQAEAEARRAEAGSETGSESPKSGNGKNGLKKKAA